MSSSTFDPGLADSINDFGIEGRWGGEGGAVRE